LGALEIKGIFALTAAWIGYFIVHSLLASLAVKHRVAQRWPHLMPLYRLLFNFQALVLLVPPLWLTFALRGPLLWQWSGIAWWLVNGLAVLAIGGVFWSLRTYDGSEFLGLRQWREKERSVEDQERFHLSDLHRFVRHPWYSLGLVLVWTRDMDPAFLTSAILITLYFIVGAWLEEGKLLVYHGEQYRRYRKRVPMLCPNPWRFLTREEAREIEKSGGQGF
jgi:protein-S-isoprenylcysteine O-methyltransferase Ste14